MASGTKPKKAAVRLVHLVLGLVSVATNAAYTRLGRWAASNACSIKACLCVLNVRARPNSPDFRVICGTRQCEMDKKHVDELEFQGYWNQLLITVKVCLPKLLNVLALSSKAGEKYCSLWVKNCFRV
jgi:hypothetical protein